MVIKKIFIVLLCCSGLFSMSKEECKSKIDEINKNIEYLEDARRGLESAAIKYENQAQRYQFNSDQLVEAKRFWKLAEQNRNAIKDIDKKLQDKRAERKKLIDSCSLTNDSQ